MSVKAALALGGMVVLAALAHGGFYAAGHDFVVNRFTGHHEFVPAGAAWEEGEVPVRKASRGCPSLTSSGPEARVAGLQRGR